MSLSGLVGTFGAVMNRARLGSLDSRSQILWGTAGIAAAGIVLRYLFSRNASYSSNLGGVGRQVKDTAEYDFDEFDVIIVGGGILYLFLVPVFPLTKRIRYRYCWVLSCRASN